MCLASPWGVCGRDWAPQDGETPPKTETASSGTDKNIEYDAGGLGGAKTESQTKLRS